jgi:hypothetical protein
MRYYVLIGVLAAVGFLYYGWTIVNPAVPQGEPLRDAVATTPVAEVNIVPNATEQLYRNEEWGITFSYPSDWVIKEPAFGSAVSLFNFSIEPEKSRKYPETILFNITPKAWIENAITKMQMDGIIFSNTKISGLDAIRFESSYEGMLQIDYLILVNDTYWINVAGKKDYEETLNQVLASLVITPVEIPAANQ